MPDDDVANAIVPVCPFCGDPEHVELHEVWSSHEFMIETCCEGLHVSVVQQMTDDPGWARSLLRRMGVEEIIGARLRRLTDDEGCGMLLDWQLQLRDVTFATARTFVRRHHAHCNPPAAWRFGQAILNGPTMLGVAMVGNPVAPALNRRGIVEVNRLCIRRDVPCNLAWNAASMLYGWCAREAERKGWSHIVTYTRADENGTSLRAAGWKKESSVRGRGWHSTRRGRSNKNAWIDKVRWGKPLRPRKTPPRTETSHVHTPRADDCLHNGLFGDSQRATDRLVL